MAILKLALLLLLTAVIRLRTNCRVFICLVVFSINCAAQIAPKDNAISSAKESPDYRMDTVLNSIRQTKNISGLLTQQRSIPNLNKPAISSGRFLFVQGSGIYWEINSPIFEAYTFMPKKTLAWSQSGVQIKTSGVQNRAAKSIGKIVVSLFSGDKQQIEKNFTIKWHNYGDQWQAELKPKRAILAKSISSIWLSGTQQVNAITLNSSNGQINHITFTGLIRPKTKSDRLATEPIIPVEAIATSSTLSSAAELCKKLLLDNSCLN